MERLGHVIADNGDCITCEVVIRGEMKIVDFYRTDYIDHYKSKEKVYVQIPTAGTKRSYGLLSNSQHENKVRQAVMYMRRKNKKYQLTTAYTVADGVGYIVSWVNSEWGEIFRRQEALDFIYPLPKPY